MAAPTHRARKRFGQHFLTDISVINAITHAINPDATDHMVEIGPGLGALTQQLLPLVGELDVVELDRDVIPKLEKVCLPLGKLRIHSADALNFDYCQLVAAREKLRIVGNLPYNISTPLIFNLIHQAHCVADMHFMLQKEVVDRMAAQPSNSNYGKLSVMVQYFCRVDALFDVPPTAFSPPPKVDSSIVRLIPYAEAPVEVGDIKQFEHVVAQAFSQRRKTLRNTLKHLLTPEQITACGVDPGRRAETLSLQEFALLSRHVAEP